MQSIVSVPPTASSRQECLDHFVILATAHMDVLCREYLAYYLTERPHQGAGIDNELLMPAAMRKKCRASHSDALPKLSDIRCKSRLGGLLKSYSRAA